MDICKCTLVQPKNILYFYSKIDSEGENRFLSLRKASFASFGFNGKKCFTSLPSCAYGWQLAFKLKLLR